LKEFDSHSDEIKRKVEHDIHLKEKIELELTNSIGVQKRQFLAGANTAASSSFEICEIVAKQLSIQLTNPGSGIDLMPMDSQVIEICEHSGIRYRRIMLEGDWWKQDQGSFVSINSVGNAVAIIYRKGAYFLVEIGRDKPQQISRAVADGLANYGYTFFCSFPEKKLKLRDILQFGLKGSRSDVVRLWVLGGLFGLLSIFVPAATGILFNDVVPSANKTMLYELSFGLLVAGLSMGAFKLTQSLALLRLEGQIDIALQAALWDRLLDLPLSFFKKYSAGDLAKRAMGINAIRHTLSGPVISGLLGGVFSIFNFFLLFYYSPSLAIIATLLILFFSGISIVLHLRELKVQRQLSDQRGFISGKLLQFVMGVSKIRIAGAEISIIGQWSKAFSREKELEQKVDFYTNIITAMNYGIPLFFSLVIFAIVGSGYSDLSTGSFLAFSAAFGSFMVAMITLSNSFVSVLKVLPIFNRTLPILEEQREVTAENEDPGPLKGAIELNQIKFRYNADAPYLFEQLSLKINPGEYVAMVGPSGAGKSSVMRLLLGFEQAESGSIYYDDHDLSLINIKAVRRQCGVVMQNSKLQPGSIFENIIGSSNLTMEDAWQAARKAGLEQEIKELPMGMHTMIPQGGGSLSGGQQQRLMIARALVHNPSILLFDEATSALDNLTQKIVAETLRQQKITRIVIAHRLSTIQEVDRVFVINGGRIEQEGTVDELLEQEGVFREMSLRQEI
jgi:NHLM bacteriocin system ABC transporter ATP-binding protein